MLGLVQVARYSVSYYKQLYTKMHLRYYVRKTVSITTVETKYEKEIKGHCKDYMKG